MRTLRSIEELNWALKIYSDIIKRGSKSPLFESSNDCMGILEEFEEYEKCSDLYEVIKSLTTGEKK
jgi:hypothetical protein